MNRLLIVLTIATGVFGFQISNAQVPFHRGVNLSNWFQTTSPRQIQPDKFTKQDFENIKSLGCDVIRLPINLYYMTNGKPDYQIDPRFLAVLDQAEAWAEELQIYLLLDNHSTDDVASKNPDLETSLAAMWAQMSRHYKNSSDYILYEIMNEPNDLTTNLWGEIQQTVIDTIRKIDTQHTIIVGPSVYNTYTELNSLPVSAFANVSAFADLSFNKISQSYGTGDESYTYRWFQLVNRI